EYERLISSAPTFVKSRLYNQGCSAVALVTLKYQPEVATEFWKGLAEDDALAKGDARKTLLDDMKRRRLETGANNQSALTASIAWNAWFDHRRLSIVKIAPNAKVRIAGTPFDGGREKCNLSRYQSRSSTRKMMVAGFTKGVLGHWPRAWRLSDFVHRSACVHAGR